MRTIGSAGRGRRAAPRAARARQGRAGAARAPQGAIAVSILPARQKASVAEPEPKVLRACSSRPPRPDRGRRAQASGRVSNPLASDRRRRSRTRIRREPEQREASDGQPSSLQRNRRAAKGEFRRTLLREGRASLGEIDPERRGFRERARTRASRRSCRRRCRRPRAWRPDRRLAEFRQPARVSERPSPQGRSRSFGR